MSKNLLLFKRIDFWVQTFLICFWFLSFLNDQFKLFNFNKFSDYWAIPFFYFWVGIWQLSSFFLTLILINYWQKVRISLGKKIYAWVILIIFVLGMATIKNESLLLIGLFLLFCSPILAFFYLWITWMELQTLKESSKKL